MRQTPIDLRRWHESEDGEMTLETPEGVVTARVKLRSGTGSFGVWECTFPDKCRHQRGHHRSIVLRRVRQATREPMRW